MREYERKKVKHAYNSLSFRKNEKEECVEINEILVSSLKDLIYNNKQAKLDFLSVAKTINNDINNEMIHLIGSVGLGIGVYIALTSQSYELYPGEDLINEAVKILASGSLSFGTYCISQIAKDISYFAKSNKIASLTCAMLKNSDLSSIQPEEIFSDTDPKIMETELEGMCCNALAEVAMDEFLIKDLQMSSTKEQEK